VLRAERFRLQLLVWSSHHVIINYFILGDQVVVPRD
jgi:hypothetical protein